MEKSVYCKWAQPTATLVHAAFYTHVFLEQQTVLALERVFAANFILTLPQSPSKEKYSYHQLQKCSLANPQSF